MCEVSILYIPQLVITSSELREEVSVDHIIDCLDLG